MRIILLTQDEPFYLAENIEYLIKNLPEKSTIEAIVLFKVSPFGKKESFLKKARKTYTIFGLSFFLYYTFKYGMAKFKKSKKVPYILKKHNIPQIRLTQSVNHEESLKMISDYRPDLLISIAGNQIFKKKLLHLAPEGCLNLHTSLLPEYRGLMPSFWVLKNKEHHTGVSVFFVDEKIDNGPILIQKTIKIEENMTHRQLIRRSKKEGMKAIIAAIRKIQSGNYELIENNEEEKSYFSFPTREDVKLFYKNGKKFF